MTFYFKDQFQDDRELAPEKRYLLGSLSTPECEFDADLPDRIAPLMTLHKITRIEDCMSRNWYQAGGTFRDYVLGKNYWRLAEFWADRRNQSWKKWPHATVDLQDLEDNTTEGKNRYSNADSFYDLLQKQIRVEGRDHPLHDVGFIHRYLTKLTSHHSRLLPWFVIDLYLQGREYPHAGAWAPSWAQFWGPGIPVTTALQIGDVAQREKYRQIQQEFQTLDKLDLDPEHRKQIEARGFLKNPDPELRDEIMDKAKQEARESGKKFPEYLVRITKMDGENVKSGFQIVKSRDEKDEYLLYTDYVDLVKDAGEYLMLSPIQG